MIEPRNIQRWRNGEVNPNIGFVKRMAVFFRLPVRSFLIQENAADAERLCHTVGEIASQE